MIKLQRHILEMILEVYFSVDVKRKMIVPIYIEVRYIILTNLPTKIDSYIYTIFRSKKQ